MNKEIKIVGGFPLSDIIYRFGTRVSTPEGNSYYEIPFWFKSTENGWVLYGKDLPDDLMQFITKARLGGDNPQPEKVEL